MRKNYTRSTVLNFILVLLLTFPIANSFGMFGLFKPWASDRYDPPPAPAAEHYPELNITLSPTVVEYLNATGAERASVFIVFQQLRERHGNVDEAKTHVTVDERILVAGNPCTGVVTSFLIR